MPLENPSDKKNFFSLRPTPFVYCFIVFFDVFWCLFFYLSFSTFSGFGLSQPWTFSRILGVIMFCLPAINLFFYLIYIIASSLHKDRLATIFHCLFWLTFGIWLLFWFVVLAVSILFFSLR